MKCPSIMGILNLTPDSFSGDGIATPEMAVVRFEQLVAEGVDIVDLGAESTRPGARKLTSDEEWARLQPVLSALAAHPLRRKVKLSVDSYHAATIARALSVGIDIVNDVSGLTDPAMLNLLAMHDGDIVVMHALSIPADPMHTLPEDTAMVPLLLQWKAEVTARAEAAGIAPQRLIYDPGLGFGKQAEQSMHLVLHAEELVAAGGRWLYGHSRKSFLKLLTDAEGADRDEATLLLSGLLAQAGVATLRVHNVTRHRELMDRICK